MQSGYRACVRGLYAITPAMDNTDELARKVELVLAGGAQCIQYRNKMANMPLLRKQAQMLLGLCRAFQAPLIINDHVELAREIEADGVHIGQHDASISAVREQLGDYKMIGASCYNSMQLAEQAQKAGADYVAFGAFFSSVTKPEAVPAAVDLLELARGSIQLPVVAIGGITLANANQLVQHGCTAMAVCNELFQSKDIKTTAQRFAALFMESGS